MSSVNSVAVIGLGLIGGSVARGLAHAGVDVVAYDSNPDHLEAALSEGVVSRRVSADFSDLGSCDIVAIAVEGSSSCEVLRRLADSSATISLVTDVGSTKRSIVAAAEKSRLASVFVGSHPFAGDHRSGWNASRADLFLNEVVYMSATSQSNDSSVTQAKELWTLLGGRPEMIEAAEHDELVAWTSHLPHFISGAFTASLAEAGIARVLLGRGGRDVSRLAGGSVEVWTSIAMDNADKLAPAIDEMRRQLDELSAALHHRDKETVRARLLRAREWASA